MVSKEHERLLSRIAGHFGYNAQSRILIGECAELIQAVSKYGRESTQERRDNLIEEIADVEIMIAQIKYLLSIEPEEIEMWKEFKVDRTIERMRTKE